MSVVLPAISREGSRGDISDAAKRQSHPDSPPRKRRARKKKAKAGDPKEIAAGAEIARALANIGNSSRTAAEIAVLQDMQDDVNRKLEKETDRDRELAVGLMELEKTLSKAKKAQGGVYFITKNTADLTKEVKNLEKRLDKARSNYNLAVDDNNRLRREIETTRHEIEAGDAMIKQEMAALTKKQLELRDLSEAMQSSYYRRDRAEADMHTMKADADAAEVSFRTQWTRLVRVMDEDAKRSHDEKRVKLKSQGDRVAEDRHKKTVIELERKIQSKKLDQKAQEKERTESLEQASNRKTALNQIFNATGVDNVDDLVDALLEKQERVNHDYKQMETIERELSAATYSVESMKAVQAGNAGKHQEAEGHRRRVEVQLDEQLKKVDAKGMDADGEVLAAGKIESNLYPKVQRIHELLRCGPRQSSLQIDPGPMDMARMMAMLAEIEPALMRLVHRMDGE
jgi:chromosome segregation ATPase|eukprot:COSAG01_NODE_324_length_18846_cov_60.042193_4_plen_456_part_00